MRRQEMWAESYRRDPYMESATPEAVAQRSRDIMANMLGVSERGGLIPGKPRLPNGDINPGWEQWMARWTHILEEMGNRGGIRSDQVLIDREAMPWLSAPQAPRGFKILQGGSLPPAPFLAKIGRQEHMFPLFDEGKLRMAPASNYSDPSLNSAQRDDELTVTAVRSGRGDFLHKIDRETGKRGPPLPLVGEVQHSLKLKKNYYVLCFSYTYDPRLLDDFGGNALLLVTGLAEFANRARLAVERLRPDLQLSFGAPQYYDPYFVDPNRGWIPMMKHFRYAYQREFRLVWTGDVPADAKPFFVELGSLRDIAQYYALPS